MGVRFFPRPAWNDHVLYCCMIRVVRRGLTMSSVKSVAGELDLIHVGMDLHLSLMTSVWVAEGLYASILESDMVIICLLVHSCRV